MTSYSRYFVCGNCDGAAATKEVRHKTRGWLLVCERCLARLLGAEMLLPLDAEDLRLDP